MIEVVDGRRDEGSPPADKSTIWEGWILRAEGVTPRTAARLSRGGASRDGRFHGRQFPEPPPKFADPSEKFPALVSREFWFRPANSLA